MTCQSERYEKLEKILRRIVNESSQGAVTIVEGRNDRTALRKLGITGPVICCKASRKGFADFLYGINAKKVIILTDFDQEGSSLSCRMEEELVRLRVKVNGALRRQLGALLKPDARTIEELLSCVERIRMEEKKPPKSARPITGAGSIFFHDVYQVKQPA